VASYKLTDYPVPDWGTFANSLARGPSMPGVVSFDLRWGPVIRRYHMDNKAQGWQGDFIETDGSISWHGTTPSVGFSFVSSASKRQYQAFGKERNGVFYGKPSAFFPNSPASNTGTPSTLSPLPNTGGSPGSLIVPGMATGSLALAAAAAFLRRRERFMAEAASGSQKTSA
jgi:LPXTG-motif cell wall-anchored protein